MLKFIKENGKLYNITLPTPLNLIKKSKNTLKITIFDFESIIKMKLEK